MNTLAELIASPYISQVTAALGAAILLLFRANKKILIVGLWFLAEFSCDIIVNGLSEYWTYGDSTAYFYLYSSTAVMFAYYTIRRKDTYGKTVPYIFSSIAILSVIFCVYRYELLSNWYTWGEPLYNDMGSTIDGFYLLLIVALDALLVYIGFTNDRSNRFNA